jgi:lipopolysaccharide/colanic/teichoic acid biosynthesis glycosyltransferase
MKRSIDIVASLIGLAILSPLLLVIAAAIWIEDRHSPFFIGKRVARGGGFFRMVKFRSMRLDAWKTVVSSTAAGDQRITRVGRVIRRFKLDEFPQLWNVLMGDMSLVGPRPQVEIDARMYTIEEQRMLGVRPGLTDIASIVFADEGEILAGALDPDLRYNQIIRPWKSRLGLLYIDKRTLAADFTLIFLTIASAVSRAYALAHITRLLDNWNADPLVVRMAGRNEPLLAWPPPGASAVVNHYPKLAA